MGKLISSWALAGYISIQIERWLVRLAIMVPRRLASHLRALLRELEDEIREALNSDADALNIAPYTPEAHKKRQADKPASSREPGFRISISLVGQTPRKRAASKSTPSTELPTEPLKARFARASAVLDDPAPYARRLALRLARKCAPLRTLPAQNAADNLPPDSRLPGLDPGPHQAGFLKLPP